MFLFEIIAAAWFFVFGSVIGSFINVVVYRTPGGQSILGSSRCPRCTAAIRWHDNIPIAGWFLLRGRCRDCGLPIAFRYPAVEFVTACLFLVLALAELFSGGANLPPPAKAEPFAGFAGLISQANWTLVRMYVLHVVLVSALFTWALMRVDRSAVPQRQVALLWIFIFAMVTLWPGVHPLLGPPDAAAGSDDFPYWDGFRSAACGFLAGGAVALGWMGLRGSHGDKLQNAALAAGLTSIGAALGWQSVVSILFITALSRGVTSLAAWRSRRLRDVPLLMDVMVACVVHLCFWRNLWRLEFWPGAGGVWLNLAATAIALAVLLAVERTRPQR